MIVFLYIKMKKFAFNIVFIIAILNIGLGFTIVCPNPKDLKPCTCKPMAFGLNVVCADFTDSQDLYSAFKALRNYKVDNVLLHNLMLKEVLPKDLFEGMVITEIGVEKSNLTFAQPVFKGLDETLGVLRIAHHSVVKSADNFIFARLKHLTKLTIKDNAVGRVADHWLNEKTPNIVKLVLDEDDIRILGNKAFADLPFLEHISLAENKIKDVKRSMFPMPAQNLKEIELSNNKIEFLPEDFFSEMDSLTKVVLFGNGLTTLSESTWGKVWSQLETVVLLNNNLICDSSMSWMKSRKWPEVLDANCVAPSALFGKDLKDVYDFT